MTEVNKVVDDQLDKVNGGMTEAELQMQNWYRERQEYVADKAKEDAERREWEDEQALKRYQEQQARMRQQWGR